MNINKDNIYSVSIRYSVKLDTYDTKTVTRGTIESCLGYVKRKIERPIYSYDGVKVYPIYNIFIHDSYNKCVFQNDIKEDDYSHPPYAGVFKQSVYMPDFPNGFFNNFEDVSYKNDICPSFVIRKTDKVEYVLFVEAKKRSNREDYCDDRFLLIVRGIDENNISLPDSEVVIRSEKKKEIMKSLLVFKALNNH